MDAIAELKQLLRPAAGGLYLVSTGRAAQIAVQQKLYGVTSEAAVQTAFERTLEQIAAAKVVMLGVPSDVGAGFLRGANQGPQAIRETLLADAAWPAWMRDHGIVDIGDVFVVPQLLHDDMLSDRQLSASRRALYPQVTEPLPVSPLSCTERVLELVFALNPHARPFVIGGDHSCAWPVAKTLAAVRRDRWGIVQPDAHTDLLAERLGVKYCFATWSYHANDLLGRDGRLVQVGTRASRFPREHWESTLAVRQFWADECLRDEAKALDAILAHVRERKITAVYFSNDIDGTDERFADATGTPEPQGLTPDFVVGLIRRLGKETQVIGGDIMEVAPALQRTPAGREATLQLAARYTRETLAAMVGGAS